MKLENLVYDWITQDGNLSTDQVTNILEEKDDIEIALELWEELTYSYFTVDDVEQEVSYFRKKRPDVNQQYEY